MTEYILCESSPAYSACCFICLGKPIHIYLLMGRVFHSHGTARYWSYFTP